jgi:hypothetical protein
MASRPSFRGRMGVEDEKHGEQERAGKSREPSNSPPNTVAMPIVASGHAAPGGYGNTGDRLNRNGSLGNTLQDSYNEHQGHGRKGGGKKGEVLGHEESNFYNELGKGEGDGEGDSGSGTGRARSIRGFGEGKSTFQVPSEDYNDIGPGGSNDNEGNSGSGIFKQKAGGPAKKIDGFSNSDGEISGFC